MDNNNPNNMTNEDLEKDAQSNVDKDVKGNQENIQKTTAAEEDLIEPEKNNGEDGSLPDPEETSWVEEEDGYDDPDKFSG